MKWQDVKVGQRVNVKGETWEVTAREGDSVTMLHARLGERTGSPPPDSEVQVIAASAVPKPNEKPHERMSDRERTEATKRLEDAYKAQRREERKPDERPPSDSPELVRLREFARSEGYRASQVDHLDLNELRGFLQDERAKKVAKDHGVPVSAVRDAQVRLVLGATLIAELHTSEPPQVQEVDVMDAPTMRTHLHFFHDCYPAEEVTLDELKLIHEEREVHERHEHSIPF